MLIYGGRCRNLEVGVALRLKYATLLLLLRSSVERKLMKVKS